MSGEACRRGGCKGLVEDGYCNVCGLSQTRTTIQPMPGRSTAAMRPQEASSKDVPGTLTTDLGAAPFSRAAAGARRTGTPGPHSNRKQLGAGLIALPDLPSVEPERAVLIDPSVPERKRICSKCDAPLRREAGFCGKCGTRYSFVATLRAGDIVAKQYEVKGPLAFGGLGWVYLAFDRLLSRYVVLKGLLNAQDSSAAAAAVAERQFLAAVKHPNIVAIYNFVQAAGEGFIVMEYVGGKTLKQIRQERGPLPPSEAVAYIHRILPAFAYLHRMGLVFCDFKPDNVMLEHDDVKLIDLGGVRRIDDPNGDIYGTVGYSAPEAGAGPTSVSDLFTVGRTLAVLLMDIGGFGKEHQYTLPSPQDKPVLQQQESLHRFLLKATARHPDDRFCSADEMAEQLLGVLREIVARETGTPRPSTSTEFGVDLLSLETADEMEPVAPNPRHLPVPSLHVRDPGAQTASAAMALPDRERSLAALRLALQQTPDSREVRLRLAATLTQSGQTQEAEELLGALGKEDAWDWRVFWFQACVFLARNQPGDARRLFDQVYFDLPGELAPKLAVGLAAELEGDTEKARGMYDLVSRVDPAYVSAVFGLARCERRRGNRRAAVAALQRIPPSSALYVRAQVEAMRTLLVVNGTRPPLDEVVAASTMSQALPLDERDRLRLNRIVFQAALSEIGTTRGAIEPNASLLGRPLSERGLRAGLEDTLRAMARFADGEDRILLIDEANRVRPRTFF